MPTVLRTQGYRVYFYSHEPNEPPHVHIDKGGSTAKFWLERPALASSIGFSPKELNVFHKLVAEYRDRLLDAWHEHFRTHR
jgi:hypothetical protein